MLEKTFANTGVDKNRFIVVHMEKYIIFGQWRGIDYGSGGSELEVSNVEKGGTTVTEQ